MEGMRIKINNPGSLTEYGYHIKDGETERRKSLRRLMKIYSRKELADKLVALEVLFKYNNPIYSKRAKSDIIYLSK